MEEERLLIAIRQQRYYDGEAPAISEARLLQTASGTAIELIIDRDAVGANRVRAQLNASKITGFNIDGDTIRIPSSGDKQTMAGIVSQLKDVGLLKNGYNTEDAFKRHFDKINETPTPLSDNITIEDNGLAIIRALPESVTDDKTSISEGVLLADVSVYAVKIHPSEDVKLQDLYDAVARAVIRAGDHYDPLRGETDLDKTKQRVYVPPHEFYYSYSDSFSQPAVQIHDGAVLIREIHLDDLQKVYQELQPYIDPSPEIAQQIQRAIRDEYRGPVMRFDNAHELGASTTFGYTDVLENSDSDLGLGNLGNVPDQDMAQRIIEDASKLYYAGKIDEAELEMHAMKLAQQLTTGALPDRNPDEARPLLPASSGASSTDDNALAPEARFQDTTRNILAAMLGVDIDSEEPIAQQMQKYRDELIRFGDIEQDERRNQEEKKLEESAKRFFDKSDYHNMERELFERKETGNSPEPTNERTDLINRPELPEVPYFEQRPFRYEQTPHLARDYGDTRYGNTPYSSRMPGDLFTRYTLADDFDPKLQRMYDETRQRNQNQDRTLQKLNDGAEDRPTENQQSVQDPLDKLLTLIDQGQLPEFFMEDMRIVDPTSEQGQAFHNFIQDEIAKKLYPERDFDENPVVFLLSDSEAPNAGLLYKDVEPRVVVITKGLVEGLAGEIENTPGSIDRLAHVVGHEMYHLEQREQDGEWGQPATDREEIAASNYPVLERMYDAGFDPKAARQTTFYFNEGNFTGNDWYGLIDEHPFTDINMSVVDNGLTALDHEKGGLRRRADGSDITPTPIDQDFLASVSEASHVSYLDAQKAKKDYEALSEADKLQFVTKEIENTTPGTARFRELRQALAGIKVTKADKESITALADKALEVSNQHPEFFNKLFVPLVAKRLDNTDEKISLSGMLGDSKLNDIYEALDAFIEVEQTGNTQQDRQEVLDAARQLVGLPYNLNELHLDKFDFPQFIIDETKKEIREIIRDDTQFTPPWAHHTAMGTGQEVSIEDRKIVAQAEMYAGIYDPAMLKRSAMTKAMFDKIAPISHPDTADFSYYKLKFNAQGTLDSPGLPSDGEGWGTPEDSKPDFIFLSSLAKYLTEGERTVTQRSGNAERVNIMLGEDNVPKQALADDFLANKNRYIAEIKRASSALTVALDGREITGTAEDAALKADPEYQDAADLCTKYQAQTLEIAQQLLAEGNDTNLDPVKQLILSNYNEVNLPANELAFFVIQDTHNLFEPSFYKEILKATIFPEDEPGSVRKMIGYDQPEDGESFKAMLGKLEELSQKVYEKKFSLSEVNSHIAHHVNNDVATFFSDPNANYNFTELAINYSSEMHEFSSLRLDEDRSLRDIYAEQVVKEQNLPNDIADRISLYRFMQKETIFPSETWRAEFAQQLSEDIANVSDIDQRRQYAEQVILGELIYDADLRESAKDIWVDAVYDQYGKDDGTQNYRDQIQPIIDQVKEQANFSQRYDILVKLSNRLETQRDVSYAVEQVVNDTGLSQEAEDALIKSYQAVAEVAKESPDARETIIDFLISDSQGEPLDGFIELLKDSDRKLIEASEAQSKDAGSDSGHAHLMGNQLAPDAYYEIQAQRFFSNFWSLPDTLRIGIMGELTLTAADKAADRQQGTDANYQKAFNQVVEKIIPQDSEYAKEARIFLKAYSEEIPEYKRPVVLAAVMALANQQVETQGSPDAIRTLSQVLRAMGPAEKKIEQGIHSHPDTDPEVRAKLEDSKTMSDPQPRWQLWERYDALVPSDYQQNFARMAELKGAASINQAIAMERTTEAGGGRSILTLQTENAQRKLEEGFKVAEAVARNVQQGHPELINASSLLFSAIKHAKSKSAFETDTDYNARQNAKAQELYNGRTVTVDGVEFTIQTAALNGHGKGWKDSEEMLGEHFNDIAKQAEESGTKADKAYVEQAATAYAAVEWEIWLGGNVIDDDGHGGNLRVDKESNVLGRFDHDAMDLTPLSEADKQKLGHILSDIITKFDAEKTFAENASDAFKAYANEAGDLPTYLASSQRANLAWNDYYRHMNAERFVDIVKTLYRSNKIDPVIQAEIDEGIAQAASEGRLQNNPLMERFMSDESSISYGNQNTDYDNTPSKKAEADAVEPDRRKQKASEAITSFDPEKYAYNHQGMALITEGNHLRVVGGANTCSIISANQVEGNLTYDAHLDADLFLSYVIARYQKETGQTNNSSAAHIPEARLSAYAQDFVGAYFDQLKVELPGNLKLTIIHGAYDGDRPGAHPPTGRLKRALDNAIDSGLDDLVSEGRATQENVTEGHRQFYSPPTPKELRGRGLPQTGRSNYAVIDGNGELVYEFTWEVEANELEINELEMVIKEDADAFVFVPKETTSEATVAEQDGADAEQPKTSEALGQWMKERYEDADSVLTQQLKETPPTTERNFGPRIIDGLANYNTRLVGDRQQQYPNGREEFLKQSYLPKMYANENDSPHGHDDGTRRTGAENNRTKEMSSGRNPSTTWEVGGSQGNNSPQDMTTPEMVKSIRKMEGLTQKEFAKKYGFGGVKGLSNVENGKTTLGKKQLEKLLDAELPDAPQDWQEKLKRNYELDIRDIHLKGKALDEMNLGELVEYCRRIEDLSQRKVAAKYGFGYPIALTNVEIGAAALGKKQLEKLLDAELPYASEGWQDHLKRNYEKAIRDIHLGGKALAEMNLGELVQYCRRIEDLTQGEFADKYGFNQQEMLFSIENDKRGLNQSQVTSILSAELTYAPENLAEYIKTKFEQDIRDRNCGGNDLEEMNTQQLVKYVRAMEGLTQQDFFSKYSFASMESLRRLENGKTTLGKEQLETLLDAELPYAPLEWQEQLKRNYELDIRNRYLDGKALDEMNLGELVQYCRRIEDLTQADFAEKYGFGPVATFSSIELGGSALGKEQLDKLLKAELPYASEGWQDQLRQNYEKAIRDRRLQGNDLTDMNLGELVEYRRRIEGLSKDEFVKKYDFNDVATLTKIESGQKGLNQSQVTSILSVELTNAPDNLSDLIKMQFEDDTRRRHFGGKDFDSLTIGELTQYARQMQGLSRRGYAQNHSSLSMHDIGTIEGDEKSLNTTQVKEILSVELPYAPDNFSRDVKDKFEQDIRQRHCDNAALEDMDIQQWVKYIRMMEGLTQGEMAEKLNVAKPIITAVETGNEQMLGRQDRGGDSTHIERLEKALPQYFKSVDLSFYPQEAKQFFQAAFSSPPSGRTMEMSSGRNPSTILEGGGSPEGLPERRNLARETYAQHLDEAWVDDASVAKDALEARISAFKGRFPEEGLFDESSADEVLGQKLSEILQEHQKIYEDVYLLEAYHQVNFLLNMDDSDAKANYVEAKKIRANFDANLDYWKQAVAALGEDRVQRAIRASDDPNLSNHEGWFKQLTDFPNQVNVANQRIGGVFQGLQKDVRFTIDDDAIITKLSQDTSLGFTYPEDGELNSSQLLKLRRHSDRDVRLAANEAYAQGFYNIRNDASELMNQQLEYAYKQAQENNFNNARELALYAHNIDYREADALAEAITNQSDQTSQALLTQFSRLAGADDTNFADYYVPLQGTEPFTMSWADTKQFLVDTLSPYYDDETTAYLKEYLENNIDGRQRGDKFGSAFVVPGFTKTDGKTVESMGSLLISNPDALTLEEIRMVTHEIAGHVNEFQQYHNSQRVTNSADRYRQKEEVSSRFHEAMILDALENKMSDDQRILMKAQEVKDTVKWLGTQVQYYNFEKRLHEEYATRRESGNTDPFTAGDIEKIYAEESQKIFGNIEFADNWGFTWANARAITSPFNSSLYMFGEMGARGPYAAFAEAETPEQKKQVMDGYIDALRQGNALSFNEFLQQFYPDVESAEIYKQAMEAVAQDMQELERLVDTYVSKAADKDQGADKNDDHQERESENSNEKKGANNDRRDDDYRDRPPPELGDDPDPSPVDGDGPDAPPKNADGGAKTTPDKDRDQDQPPPSKQGPENAGSNTPGKGDFLLQFSMDDNARAVNARVGDASDKADFMAVGFTAVRYLLKKANADTPQEHRNADMVGMQAASGAALYGGFKAAEVSGLMGKLEQNVAYGSLLQGARYAKLDKAHRFIQHAMGNEVPIVGSLMTYGFYQPAIKQAVSDQAADRISSQMWGEIASEAGMLFAGGGWMSIPAREFWAIGMQATNPYASEHSLISSLIEGGELLKEAYAEVDIAQRRDVYTPLMEIYSSAATPFTDVKFDEEKQAFDVSAPLPHLPEAVEPPSVDDLNEEAKAYLRQQAKQIDTEAGRNEPVYAAAIERVLLCDELTRNDMALFNEVLIASREALYKATEDPEYPDVEAMSQDNNQDADRAMENLLKTYHTEKERYDANQSLTAYHEQQTLYNRYLLEQEQVILAYQQAQGQETMLPVVSFPGDEELGYVLAAEQIASIVESKNNFELNKPFLSSLEGEERTRLKSYIDNYNEAEFELNEEPATGKEMLWEWKMQKVYDAQKSALEDFYALPSDEARMAVYQSAMFRLEEVEKLYSKNIVDIVREGLDKIAFGKGVATQHNENMSFAVQNREQAGRTYSAWKRGETLEGRSATDISLRGVGSRESGSTTWQTEVSALEYQAWRQSLAQNGELAVGIDGETVSYEQAAAYYESKWEAKRNDLYQQADTFIDDRLTQYEEVIKEQQRTGEGNSNIQEWRQELEAIRSEFAEQGAMNLDQLEAINERQAALMDEIDEYELLKELALGRIQDQAREELSPASGLPGTYEQQVSSQETEKKPPQDTEKANDGNGADVPAAGRSHEDGDELPVEIDNAFNRLARDAIEGAEELDNERQEDLQQKEELYIQHYNVFEEGADPEEGNHYYRVFEVTEDGRLDPVMNIKGGTPEEVMRRLQHDGDQNLERIQIEDITPENAGEKERKQAYYKLKGTTGSVDWESVEPPSELHAAIQAMATKIARMDAEAVTPIPTVAHEVATGHDDDLAAIAATFRDHVVRNPSADQPEYGSQSGAADYEAEKAHIQRATAPQKQIDALGAVVALMETANTSQVDIKENTLNQIKANGNTIKALIAANETPQDLDPVEEMQLRNAIRNVELSIQGISGWDNPSNDPLQAIEQTFNDVIEKINIMYAAPVGPEISFNALPNQTDNKGAARDY